MSHDAQPLANLGVTSGPLDGPCPIPPSVDVVQGVHHLMLMSALHPWVASVLHLASDLGGSPTDVWTAFVALAARHVWL